MWSNIFKSYLFRRQFRRQFLIVFHVNLQAPSACITATSCKFGEVWLSTSKVINEINVKFAWVFLKVIHFDVNSDVNS